MTASWSAVLRDLADQVPHVAENDLWFFLTAAGLTLEGLTEADALVTMIAQHEPELASKRIADLGSGVGRHLVPLGRLGADVLGIETSPALADIARRFVTRTGLADHVAVEVASLHDLAEFGTFDIVCASAHCLLLGDDHRTLIGTLQLIRAAMPDYGLLVVETLPVDVQTLTWAGPNGLSVVEQRDSTASGVHHHFRIAVGERLSEADLRSFAVPVDVWPALAEEGGFSLESVRHIELGDGTRSTVRFLRAQKGFNFVSDLADFLAAWAEPRHPRNKRAIRWSDADPTYRVRPRGAVALGQGASLAKHHPDFDAAIELRIRPLVRELVGGWNYVTYSSCAGHLVSTGPREVFSEAYCGVVVFSNQQLAHLARLVDEATRGLDAAHVRVELRVRPLHGTSTTLTAADVLVRRARPDVSWLDYSLEAEDVVRFVTDGLAERRRRP